MRNASIGARRTISVVLFSVLLGGILAACGAAASAPPGRGPGAGPAAAPRRNGAHRPRRQASEQRPTQACSRTATPPRSATDRRSSGPARSSSKSPTSLRRSTPLAQRSRGWAATSERRSSTATAKHRRDDHATAFPPTAGRMPSTHSAARYEVGEQTDTADVTGQIVDLDARIRNLRASETALVKHLSDAGQGGRHARDRVAPVRGPRPDRAAHRAEGEPRRPGRLRDA